MNAMEKTAEITHVHTKPFTLIFHTGYHPNTETMINGQRRLPCARNTVANAVISALLSTQPITDKNEIDPEAYPYLIYKTSRGSRTDPANAHASFFVTCENFAYLLGGANQILKHGKTIGRDNAMIRAIDKLLSGTHHKLQQDMNIDNVVTDLIYSQETQTSPQITYWIRHLSENPYARTRWVTAIPEQNFVGLTTMTFENATEIEPQSPQTLTKIPTSLFNTSRQPCPLWIKDHHRNQITISLSDIPKWLISDAARQDAETLALRDIAADALSTSLSLIAEIHTSRQIDSDADHRDIHIQDQPSYPTELTILFNTANK